jgi:23S rRNA (uracil1939-C5)-methyltransferase
MKASCRHQRRCSGCPQIHLPAEKQLLLKGRTVLQHVQSTLRRTATGGFIGMRAVVKSPLPFGYRTSVKLCLNEDGNGRRSVGLYKRGSKLVIDIPDCPVQHQLINNALKILMRDRRPGLDFYNHERSFQEQRIKFLTVRACPDTGDLGLIVSHTGVDKKELSRWFKVLDLLRVSVYESELSRSDADLVIGPACNYLTGKKNMRFKVGIHEFELPPAAFFQANFSLTERFVEHVVRLPEGERAAQTLLDLYGGFGAYGLASQAMFKKIHIVDGNLAATKAAAIAAAKYDYSNIEVHGMYVEDFLARGLSPGEQGAVTHVIVNPPRLGVSAKVRSSLCSQSFQRISQLTYVSCNPETLGRDLQEFLLKGHFRVTSVTPFDMFPQTEHVEVVVKLRR